jgi:hypothetical protein
MYYLQMFNVDEHGQPVDLVQMGNEYLSPGSAVAAAQSLRLGTRFRVTSEGGSLVLEDSVPAPRGAHAA